MNLIAVTAMDSLKICYIGGNSTRFIEVYYVKWIPLFLHPISSPSVPYLVDR